MNHEKTHNILTFPCCRFKVDEIRIAQAKVDPKKKAEVKAGRFKADGSPSGKYN